MNSPSPTLAEVLNSLSERIKADVRVAVPGEVQRYDAATQLADVKPQIVDRVENDLGELEDRPVPVIPNVPVLFPGCAGFHLTFPIAKGDTVLLVFNDRSIDAWQSGGGDTAPADARRHHLTDAVAIPGLHPNNAAIQGGTDGSVITIGSDSGSGDFVATAQRVLDLLNQLKTAIHNWVVVPNDGGAALKTALEALFTTWPTAPASATVKVKG